MPKLTTYTKLVCTVGELVPQVNEDISIVVTVDGQTTIDTSGNTIEAAKAPESNSTQKTNISFTVLKMLVMKHSENK